MLSLISYWGVVTLLVAIISFPFIPLFIVLSNHLLKTISNGELGSKATSHYIITKFKLIGVLDMTNYRWSSGYYSARSGDTKIYYFDAGCSVIAVLTTVVISVITLAVLTNPANPSLITIIHNIASRAAPELSYGLIGILGYLGAIKAGKVVYRLSKAVSKLESTSKEN